MEHSIYRIIDANFNRAREAVRVIEDFCRFAVNSSQLTERAKQLRHKISAAIDKLGIEKLIAARNTTEDVGIGQKVDEQLQRTSLNDCFIAACKRLTEALRVLAETIQTFNPAAAQTIENLRYTAYTLEKDIVLFSSPAEKFRQVKLYVIISSDLPVEIISLAGRCAAGGADCIQLRTKKTNDDTLFAVACEFVRICKSAGVISIINDRADIAVSAGADGMHLGQNDLPIEQVRKFQTTPLIIGKSTHSPEQLQLACRENPTYVSLGPVFATETKRTVEPVGLDYVRQAGRILENTGISSVAIGGISAANVEDVLKAGASAIAVCSAVTKAGDPLAACLELKRKIYAV